MSVINALEDRVLFSLDVAPETNALLQTAVALHNDRDRAEKILIQAMEQDPECLQTYFALYKFYFYSARLADAECIARQGLAMAARLGGFPDAPERLVSERADLYETEAGLFYLYTLKAVAFMNLRQDRPGIARSILASIAWLDPEDRSGASVIASLAEAIEAENDDK